MKSIAFLNTQMQKKFEEEFKKIGFRPYEMGYAHGYVAVSPDHPLHGLDYDKVYDLIDVSVWGGLTFSSKKSECAWDEQCVEMIDGGSFSDIPDDWWIFGFDTCTTTTDQSIIGNGASTKPSRCNNNSILL